MRKLIRKNWSRLMMFLFVTFIGVFFFFLISSQSLWGKTQPDVTINILNEPDQTGEICLFKGDFVQVAYVVKLEANLSPRDQIQLRTDDDDSLVSMETRGESLSGEVSLDTDSDIAVGKLKVVYVSVETDEVIATAKENIHVIDNNYIEVSGVSGSGAEAIQLAINKVANGGTVSIKAGVYEIDKTIVIDKHVTIAGEGSSFEKFDHDDKTTKLIAPQFTMVRHREDDQFAVFAFTGGATGCIKAVDIEGAEVGVMTCSSDRITDNHIEISDTFISDTVRGIWFNASTPVIVEDSKITNCLWNGISIGPDPGPGPLTKFTIVDVLIENCKNVGVFAKDSILICVNGHHYFNEYGGIVGINSDITVVDSDFGWNHFASIALFWCNPVWIAHNNIFCTYPIKGSNPPQAGHGIISALCPAVTVHDNLIEWPEVSGVLNFGSVIFMLTNTIHCAPMDLMIETVPPHFFGLGNPPNAVPGDYNCMEPTCSDNKCGCPDPSGSCHAYSIGQTVPPALPIE